MGLGLAVIYVPLLVVLVNSFNTSRTFGWPPSGFTVHWWADTAGNPGARQALATSLEIAAAATSPGSR